MYINILRELRPLNYLNFCHKSFRINGQISTKICACFSLYEIKIWTIIYFNCLYLQFVAVGSVSFESMFVHTYTCEYSPFVIASGTSFTNRFGFNFILIVAIIIYLKRVPFS